MAFQIYMGTDKRKQLDLHRRENRVVVVVGWLVCLFSLKLCSNPHMQYE